MDAKLLLKTAACLLIIFLCLCLQSCAAPVPEGSELGTFVAPKEVLSVQLIREGMNYYNGNRYMDAELRFRQALYLNPGLPNLRLNLAAALDKQAQFDEAFEIYRDLLEEEPDSVAYLSGMARLFLNAGARNAENFKDAELWYKRALTAAIDQSNAALIMQQARSLSVLAFKVGDEESALCNSSIAYALNPAVTEFIKENRLYIATGKLNLALESASAFAATHNLDLDPALLHQRALASFGLGQYKDALMLERRALLGAALDPQLKSEIELVRDFAIREHPENSSISESEPSEDEEENFKERVKTFRDGNQTALLYWPVNLLEKLWAQPLE